MNKLTGLWKHYSKAGTTYYSGKVGNTLIMVWKNEKRKDTDPDLTVTIAKVDENLPWTTLPEGDAP